MHSSGFQDHDHNACIQHGLKHLHDHCRKEGLRATELRCRVLEILLESHRALGAYDILDRLRTEGLSSQPPIAYRALDFLQTHGFVHRIERLNAFIACAHPDTPHSPAFLICRDCRTVAEANIDLTDTRLGRQATQAGFLIEQSLAEAIGLCPACAENPTPKADT